MRNLKHLFSAIGISLVVTATSLPLGWAAQSAEEVKAKILRDIERKERVVKIETGKLKRLYRKQRSLDPDRRLSEMNERGAKMSGEAALAAMKQVQEDTIKSPKSAADSFKRGSGA